MKNIYLVITFLIVTQLSFGQNKPVADSLQNDSAHINEQRLLQQQQQDKIDELIKAQIQKELQQQDEGSEKQQALIQQLHEIAVRDSLRKEEQLHRIKQLRQTAVGYPVVLQSDTLFYIFSRLGSFNAADRAAAISNRLNSLYENDFFKADTLLLAEGDNGYDIVYNGQLVIMSISEIDALYYNKSPEQLGSEYLQLIKNSILENKKANSFINWLRRIAYVALVIAGIFVVIFLINRLFNYFSQVLVRRKEHFFKGIRINTYKVFTPAQHLQFVLRVIRVIRVITILLALYLSLPILFNIFPQTEAYTYTLLNWITTPAKAIVYSVLKYLPNLFTIVVIYLFTRFAIRGVKFLATEVEHGKLRLKGFYSDWAKPTYNIVKFLLYAFMMIVIFPYLPGSGSPAFQGVSVFLGILFSLGSSSAIANIVAGLVITYMRPFKIGDRVKIGEVTGDVLEKTMLVTRIRTIKNEEITVPNSMVLSNHTVNFTAGAEEKGIIIHTTITLGYDVPWKKVHQALIDAALRTSLILKEPAPFVLQTGLEDFYVSYQINAYTKNPEVLAKIFSDLNQNIQDCCNETGIEILSPHYRAMRDGNASTIPHDYSSADYKAPVSHPKEKPGE